MRWQGAHHSLHACSRARRQDPEPHRWVHKGPTAFLQPCSAHITPGFECFTKTIVCLNADIESLLCRSCHSPITATCLVSDHG